MSFKNIKPEALAVLASALALIASAVLYFTGAYSATVFSFLDVAWVAIILCGRRINFKNLAGGELVTFFALAAAVVFGFYTSFNRRGEENIWFLVAGIAAFLFYTARLTDEYARKELSVPDGLKTAMNERLFKYQNKIPAALILIAALTLAVLGGSGRVEQGVDRALAALCGAIPAFNIPVLIYGYYTRKLKKDGYEIIRPQAFEELERVNTVLFEKTGTLTEGRITLEHIFTSTMKESELLKYAASVESGFSRPAARAIAAAHGKGELFDCEDAVYEENKGVSGTANGKKVEILRELDAKNAFPESGLFERVNKAKMTVAVLIDGSLEGLITLSDTVRESMKGEIAELNEVAETYVFTEDSSYSAKAVAAYLGINKHKGDMLPAEKSAELLRMQREEGAFVLAVSADGNEIFSQSNISLCKKGSENADGDIVTEKEEFCKLSSLIKLSGRYAVAQKLLLTGAVVFNSLVALFSLAGFIPAIFAALGGGAINTLLPLLFLRKK